MQTTIDFLDALKARHSLHSDYSVAKKLGVTRTSISNYRSKRSFFDNDTAIRVARLLDIDPGFVVACCHLERAKSDDEKAVWTRIGGLFPKKLTDTLCIM